MKKWSLFVGRWQPFHAGHKKLLETVLKKNKPVIIAIRATEISNDNPYSVAERLEMIRKGLKEYSHLIHIIVIPDIDEICYGREVGYNLRKIELDKPTEKISGTKTRKSKKHPIIWLTGNSGAGKTTLAKIICKELDALLLDGDEMRKSISTDVGFSKEERDAHNLRVARLASTLSMQKMVVVSVIAPFQSTRTKVDKICSPIWIYIKRTLPKRNDYPYEPNNKYFAVNTDKGTPKSNSDLILEYLDKVSNK